MRKRLLRLREFILGQREQWRASTARSCARKTCGRQRTRNACWGRAVPHPLPIFPRRANGKHLDPLVDVALHGVRPLKRTFDHPTYGLLVPELNFKATWARARKESSSKAGFMLYPVPIPDAPQEAKVASPFVPRELDAHLRPASMVVSELFIDEANLRRYDASDLRTMRRCNRHGGRKASVICKHTAEENAAELRGNTVTT